MLDGIRFKLLKGFRSRLVLGWWMAVWLMLCFEKTNAEMVAVVGGSAVRYGGSDGVGCVYSSQHKSFSSCLIRYFLYL